jgi:multidrug efflux system membrane fusion protein
VKAQILKFDRTHGCAQDCRGGRAALPTRVLLGLVLMHPLAGCMLSAEQPDLALAIPAAYREATTTSLAALPKADWWRGFRSNELSRLIEEAQIGNLDIAAAIARVIQADAQARVAGAVLVPAINFSGSASRTRPSQATGTRLGTTGTPSVRNQFGTVFSASYELDFWGKNRALLRAAEKNAVATRFEREVVALTAMVAVANAYFQVLAAQDRLRYARENIASASRVLTVIKQRLEVGTASALDVAQQESVLNTQRADVPTLEQILRQSTAALAVLVGRPPEFVRVRGGSMFRIAIPRVTPGLPAELLTRRPDIRAAEADLAGANANVEAARAAFFPTIELSAQGGWQASVLQWLARPDAAGVRRRAAAGATRPAERPAGGTASGLSQDHHPGVRRRRQRAGRNAAVGDPRAPPERSGRQLAARLQHRRAAAAGRHGRHHHGAQHPADVVPGAGHAGAGPARPAARHRRPVPGARRRLDRRHHASAGGTPMKTFRRIFITMVLGLLVVGGVAYIIREYNPEQQKQRRAGRPRDLPVPVLAATAKTADVPVYLDGVGTTKALNTVTVRPQVDGKLIEIAFREGQDVNRGDVLARIDPTTYQAQLDQAMAKKAQDEAQLANARRDLERYTRLAANNAATQQQADTQRAMVAQLEAQVRLDQAAIDNARAVLAYTTITAPIPGRTGIRLVDEGNIVRASDPAGIVVITQIRPISVLFNLPQQRLAQINAAFSEGTLPVDVIGADNKTIVEKGKLVVVDNQVDQTTGTVRLKAEFPNAGLQLWPGQFVNVRLLIDTLRKVVVVPTAAVQRGPNGTFVFVVQPDQTVTVRPVDVSQQDDEQSVIARGLEQGQQVVTTGFSQLAEGKRVRVTDSSTAPMGPPGDRPTGARSEGGPPEASQRGEGRRRPDGAKRGERRRDQNSSGQRPEAKAGAAPKPAP